MKTQKEALNELSIHLSNMSPMHLIGNAKFPELSYQMISNISQKGIENDFTLVHKDFFTIKNESIDLYVSNNHPYYVLGRFYQDTMDSTRFATIFDLTFRIKTNFNSIQKQLQGRDIVIIETVHVAQDYRYNKIAQTFYESILSKYIVMSDGIQYSGAKHLWKRLINNNRIYTYDIIEDKLISKVSARTPESQIWSDDTSKQRIRLVIL